MSALRKPKERANKKKKIASNLKRGRKGLLGLILEWSDSEPLNDTQNIQSDKVTHRNAIQRLIVRDMWQVSANWIVTTEFTWRLTMSVIYETEKRGDKIDEIELTYTCALMGKKSQILNDAMLSELESSLAANEYLAADHKNKGVFKTCTYKAEIICI